MWLQAVRKKTGSALGSLHGAANFASVAARRRRARAAAGAGWPVSRVGTTCLAASPHAPLARPALASELGCARGFKLGSTFEEFIGGGTGYGGEGVRSLVAYCFSVSDNFRFRSATQALSQAYDVPYRVFFSEVVHVRVRSDAVPSWPSGAVGRLGNDEYPLSSDRKSGARASDTGSDPYGDGASARADAGADHNNEVGGVYKSGSASYGDVFLFSDGSLVLWGIDSQAEHALVALIETFRPLQSDEASLSSARYWHSTTTGGDPEGGGRADGIVGVSREALQWRYGAKFGFETRENRRGRGCEMLVLSMPDGDGAESTGDANILEKVALSHGMQRSVKIDRIEFFMDALVESLRGLPTEIVVGSSDISALGYVKEYLNIFVVGGGGAVHKEALEKMGEILRLRDIINLRGSLETPDVYWDLPELEDMYDLISREFELSRRISLLNQKLDYAQELVQARRIQLKEKRGTILTNWIIILIVACVLLKCLDFHKNFHTNVTRIKRRVSGGSTDRLPKLPPIPRTVSSTNPIPRAPSAASSASTDPQSKRKPDAIE